MPVLIVCQVILTLFATVTAQFMPQMPPSMFPMAQNPIMQMAMPGAMPPVMSHPMMPNMPHLPGMQPPMPMGQPMSLPMNGGRLPMVVMPHHTKRMDNKRHKKRRSKKRSHKRPRVRFSGSSEDSCDSDSDFEFKTKNDLRTPTNPKARRQVLTPVVSYVTKEGYVVYEKKIKRDKAKDWLEMTQGRSGEASDVSRKSHRSH
ncbi:uncharacterized protein LOC142976766 [Anticarsia gemmatalis]|uniref:uncharacterized protein LOC142976766 n=1 Tax=Anticarsia gemmatalis TaxID=129554 RepID=UPI003F759088